MRTPRCACLRHFHALLQPRHHCKGLPVWVYDRWAFEPGGKALVVTYNAERNSATLDVPMLLQALGIKSATKKVTWSDFYSELHRIMFCLSLFSGACRSRQPYGGPDVTDGDLFGHALQRQVLSIDPIPATTSQLLWENDQTSPVRICQEIVAVIEMAVQRVRLPPASTYQVDHIPLRRRP